MEFGAKVIVPSAIIVSLILSLCLFVITAGATFQASKTVGENGIQMTGFDQGNSDSIGIDASNCDVSEKYPSKILKWCQIITDNANKTALPADLIAAVILQESGGNQMAYSKSGAVGLMQVMPRDGLAESFTCSSGPCFKNRPSMNELQDPEFNIQYGTRMLKNLKAKFGTYREALRSYGPMDNGYDYADRVLSIYTQYQK